MKIVLTTTLIALLAIGLLGIANSGGSISNNIDNAFAQGDGMMGNDTGMMNATLPISIISNVTLAYAQDTDMMGMDEEEGTMMNMSNQSEGMKVNWTGSIDVHSTIAEAFKSKVTTDIIGAIQAAQASIGANSVVKEAKLTDAHGYLVYKITAVDENMKKYKVIVDPGNGQVLMNKEVTWYDEHDKMKYGDKEKYDKYDKYGGDHGDDKYDKKKMMMMKDKKY
jgi:hypothetical protein